MSLLGIKVLVTRPSGQASGLIKAIEHAEGSVIHYPVLDIKPLDALIDKDCINRCKHLIMNLDHFQQVIFISTNAVRFGMDWVNNYWPQLPTDIIWHAIGKSTAQELHSLGVNVVDCTASCGYLDNRSTMNSEALLKHPMLQHIKGDKILIVRGVQGREYLQKQLEERGAHVSYAECYRRMLPNNADRLHKLLLEPIDIICVNSAESLSNLCTLAGQSRQILLQKKMIIVPSQRVKNLAIQRGFKKIYLADNASDEAIVQGLFKLTNINK